MRLGALSIVAGGVLMLGACQDPRAAGGAGGEAAAKPTEVGQKGTCGTGTQECGSQTTDPKPPPEPRIPEPRDQPIPVTVEQQGIYFHAKATCPSGKVGVGSSPNKETAIGEARADCN